MFKDGKNYQLGKLQAYVCYHAFQNFEKNNVESSLQV